MTAPEQKLIKKRFSNDKKGNKKMIISTSTKSLKKLLNDYVETDRRELQRRANVWRLGKYNLRRMDIGLKPYAAPQALIEP